MTIDELEKEVLSKPIKLLDPKMDWKEKKEVEDKALDNMKCPTCGSDVMMKVEHGSFKYYCKIDQTHYFYRWNSHQNHNFGGV